MTSLASIFTMQKALVKITFGPKFIICEPIFKNFAEIFKTFDMQKDAIILFL